MTNTEILDSLLQSAGEKLFSNYGLTVNAGGRPEQVGFSASVVAVLGFTGHDLRGSLMLAMSEQALDASRQTAGERAQDWIAELSNQMVGRIKNQLLSYGTDISLSTPLVIRGERIAPCLKGEQAPLVWNFDQGVAYGWLDCEIVEGFQLVQAHTEEAAVEEGASLLF